MQNSWYLQFQLLNLHTITLPPPCFIVCAVVWLWYAVFGLCQTWWNLHHPKCNPFLTDRFQWLFSKFSLEFLLIEAKCCRNLVVTILHSHGKGQSGWSVVNHLSLIIKEMSSIGRKWGCQKKRFFGDNDFFQCYGTHFSALLVALTWIFTTVICTPTASQEIRNIFIFLRRSQRWVSLRLTLEHCSCNVGYHVLKELL